MKSAEQSRGEPGPADVPLSDAQVLRELHESLHDIRNHLNAILGLVSILLLQSRDQAAARFRPLIEEQSDQLRHLVDQLVEPLERRRPSASHDMLVDPSRFVPSLVDLYAPYAAEHGIRLKVQVDAGTPRLSTCARSLHRLLSNVLVNAIKHSQASLVVLGAAPIDAEQPEAGVQFIVIDDGIGIDALAQQTLRSVLSGQRAPEVAYDRSGLGIVARLSQAIGASIVLDSEPHDGTTVTVAVPSRPRGPLARAT
ncbi:MAG: sensor histidine kinase [Roseateles sp.]|uniref:sensor histidine kinase n=1 Tax=Roseateles sp. TaxID=1971397 RepID=UPI0040356663